MEVDGHVYEESETGEMRLVKSAHYHIISKVRFANASRSKVAIYWLDYEGKAILYKKLKPTEFVDLNTYPTHPWIFKDCATGERLCVQNAAVFRPRRNRLRLVPESGSRIVLRDLVRITMPVRSLKRLAILTIVKIVGAERTSFDFGLPVTLQNELMSWIRAYNENEKTDS